MEFTKENGALAVEVLDLMFRATRHIQHEYEMKLESLSLPFQLSGPRLRLLLMVWRAEKIRMNELASKLGVKPRTVTELVDALERDGVLQRTPDPDDRRATLLHLTEDALNQITRVRMVQMQISDEILQNFTAEERTRLHALLSKFFEGMEFDFVY
ncbi:MULTISPECIES: MarR family winged helix-turn-helix transcriptional regulator [Paenibacillus]|uniref:MarR family transcriptional regulator n=1 Tax=Paenibacillus albilobatus TaxID=2716884 RepID=A0A919XGL5_9BACL|nr:MULTISPECIES: MarR family transcriptional regulator [Paenibacillus]GIO31028.1 MarR family transcriptional regulator [Paenibacillus albilobatus]